MLLPFFGFSLTSRTHDRIYGKRNYIGKYQLISFVNDNTEKILPNFQESSGDELDVDPNDRISVELWNKLNEEDIKNMPIINDYSSELTAMQWLTWFVRIVQRYNQVRR